MSDLPPGWEWATLGELIAADGHFSDGDWVESKDQDPKGEVRLVQLADVGDGHFRDRSDRSLTVEKAHELRCSFLEAGDVLVARMPDPLGRACIYPGSARPAVTVVDVCILRPGARSVDAKWLMWCINSPSVRAQIDAMKTGTTRKRISRSNLSKICVPVAPLAEQRRIVTVLEDHLSRLDVATQVVDRARARLRNIRLSAMRNLLRGVGIPAGVTTETADDMLATARGDVVGGEVVGAWPIPDSWRWSTIGRLFRVYVGSTPSRSVESNWHGSIPWVSSGEVSFCRITDTRERISEEALGNRATRYHPPGTVLLAMIGEGKTRGQVAILDVGAAHNQNCASIRVSETAILPEYVYVVLEERYHETRQLSSGGNQLALNSSRVRDIPIPVPPLSVQRYIVEKVAELSRMEERLASNLQLAMVRAGQLRKSLLIDAFAGRLTSQHPAGEPASVLLERLQVERSASQSGSKRRRRASETA